MTIATSAGIAQTVAKKEREAIIEEAKRRAVAEIKKSLQQAFDDADGDDNPCSRIYGD